MNGDSLAFLKRRLRNPGACEPSSPECPNVPDRGLPAMRTHRADVHDGPEYHAPIIIKGRIY
jgi:hypothetical protein